MGGALRGLRELPWLLQSFEMKPDSGQKLTLDLLTLVICVAAWALHALLVAYVS
jgi:hypothetical protein